MKNTKKSESAAVDTPLGVARRAACKTQGQCSRESGLYQSRWSRIERGHLYPATKGEAERIARTVEKTAGDLWPKEIIMRIEETATTKKRTPVPALTMTVGQRRTRIEEGPYIARLTSVSVYRDSQKETRLEFHFEIEVGPIPEGYPADAARERFEHRADPEHDEVSAFFSLPKTPDGHRLGPNAKLRRVIELVAPLPPYGQETLDLNALLAGRSYFVRVVDVAKNSRGEDLPEAEIYSKVAAVINVIHENGPK